MTINVVYKNRKYNLVMSLQVISMYFKDTKLLSPNMFFDT